LASRCYLEPCSSWPWSHAQQHEHSCCTASYFAWIYLHARAGMRWLLHRVAFWLQYWLMQSSPRDPGQGLIILDSSCIFSQATGFIRKEPLLERSRCSSTLRAALAAQQEDGSHPLGCASGTGL
jgi:hypothetical protein